MPSTQAPRPWIPRCPARLLELPFTFRNAAYPIHHSMVGELRTFTGPSLPGNFCVPVEHPMKLTIILTSFVFLLASCASNGERHRASSAPGYPSAFDNSDTTGDPSQDMRDQPEPTLEEVEEEEPEPEQER